MGLIDEMMADNPILLVRASDGVDHSGNDLDLTPFGAPAPTPGTSLVASDPAGAGIAFNGGNNLWNPEHYSELELEDEVSISALIRPSSIHVDGAEIVRKNGSYGLAITGSDNLVAFVSAGAVGSVATGPVVDVDETLLIGMSYDGTAVRLYVNGSEVASDPATGDIDLTPAIGFTIGLVDTGFVGLMDEIGVFGTALAPERFAAYYAAAMGGANRFRVRWNDEWVPGARRTRVDGEWVPGHARARVGGEWI